MKEIDPGGSQAGFKGRNSGSPLRIAGIYGEGTSSSSFLGCREGCGQGLSGLRSLPSPASS